MKKVVFVDPVKMIIEGKIGYTKHYGGASSLGRAFLEDYREDSRNGWSSDTCPQMLWWIFDNAKVPKGLSFLSAQDKFGAKNYNVTKWQFLASKDAKCNQHSTWEVICEDLSDTNYKGKRIRKKCFAGDEMQERYKCFGFRVLKGRYALDPRYDDFRVTNIIMWERV